jgi:hypothetical protein
MTSPGKIIFFRSQPATGYLASDNDYHIPLNFPKYNSALPLKIIPESATHWNIILNDYQE